MIRDRKQGPLPVAVAIPAMNEEDRIIGTLSALVEEALRYGGQSSIAVLANNCIDHTPQLAHAFAATSPVPVYVETVMLPPEKSNAGHARALAFDLALRKNRDHHDLILLSTDADTRPQPRWLSSIEAHIVAGADAVAGSIEFEPDEAAVASISPVRQLEAEYACLQAEIIALADPLAHDPWPNHLWVWGANFAVTRGAYEKAGGVPAVPLAEDRALAAALHERDCRLRHALDVRVWTSARTSGRASGGLADLIGIYQSNDGYPCDAELEAAAAVLYRATMRRRFRALFLSGRGDRAFPVELGIPEAVLDEALSASYAGQGWAMVERASQNLRRNRIFPRQLPGECLKANEILDALKGKTASTRRGLGSAGRLWSQFDTNTRRLPA